MISPDYAVIGDQVYDLQTKEKIDQDSKQLKYNQAKQEQQVVIEQLTVSDLILNTNLLASHAPKDLPAVNPNAFDYSSDPIRLRIEAQIAGTRNSSVYYLNQKRSTSILYHTDAGAEIYCKTLIKYMTPSFGQNNLENFMTGW